MPHALKSVNENRLFALLPHFFKNPEGVFVELAQNAGRAGATRLDISLRGSRLTVSDNGNGAEDPASLVILAESDWDAQVEANQTPAGWGLFFLMCLSDRIAYRSRFGEITIDCNRFLADEAYRSGILGDVDPKRATGKGFFVEALLKAETTQEIAPGGKLLVPRIEELLAYFPLSVSINCKRVARKHANEIVQHDFATRYRGNPVYVKVGDGTNFNKNRFADCLGAVWYGIPIISKRCCSESCGRAVIDVVAGGPVTPVLPYRSEIREDSAMEDLRLFVRKEAVRHCLSIVRDDSVTDTDILVRAMKALANLASDRELDGLPRYFVHVQSVHCREGAVGQVNENRIVRREEAVPKKIEQGVFTAVFPDGATREFSNDRPTTIDAIFFHVHTSNRKPSWLVIPEEELAATIVVEKIHDDNRLNRRWIRAKEILIGNVKVPFLACDDETDDLTFCFTGDPKDVYLVSDEIFERQIHCEDVEADSYETQKSYFEDWLAKDIALIGNAHNLHGLLSGFNDVCPNTEDIVSVKIDRGRKRVTLILKGGKKTTIGIS